MSFHHLEFNWLEIFELYLYSILLFKDFKVSFVQISDIANAIKVSSNTSLPAWTNSAESFSNHLSHASKYFFD